MLENCTIVILELVAVLVLILHVQVIKISVMSRITELEWEGLLRLLITCPILVTRLMLIIRQFIFLSMYMMKVSGCG